MMKDDACGYHQDQAAHIYIYCRLCLNLDVVLFRCCVMFSAFPILRIVPVSVSNRIAGSSMIWPVCLLMMEPVSVVYDPFI